MFKMSLRPGQFRLFSALRGRSKSVTCHDCIGNKPSPSPAEDNFFQRNLAAGVVHRPENPLPLRLVRNFVH